MEFSFDFEMTEENKKVIENLLKQKGVKHYVLEDKKTKEKLDLVEYKNYQELEKELNKYKSLYQNEKDHTDTLIRIIKKIEEYIKNIDEEEFINTEHYVEILDLLKEIK